ncbi:hypothetical protein KEG38_27270 [Polyangium jinanense]|uniref:hypothetical protein n=1 Tax=Polyangium jinanense TaxID=2829994 RepID=UPI002342526B|nr:hypothetical protein [Polyangium jinanense]MDC3957589.1 hypothetical protein [Polyangium jinanense]
MQRNRSGAFFALLLLVLSSLVATHAVAEESDSEQASEEDQAAESEGSEEGKGSEGEEAESEESPKAPTTQFDEVMKLNAPPPAEGEAKAAANEAEPAAEGGTATVPLAEYSELARRAARIRNTRATFAAAPVVLGAASYEGEVEGGVLALREKLVVTLAGDGLKFVPLVGDDVALVSATADGEPIGVTRRPGYHVWVTDRKGVVTVELSLLVGPRGGRGSIEYAFRSARTPSTRVAIRLPSEGLSPRFDGAVVSEVRAERGGTTARATLAPTTEIRVVGFRDVGGVEAPGAARAVAETVSLLSIDERAVELFTVVRYTILRGAMQSFEVALPDGVEVVSAEGEGAFHSTTERKDDGILLRGETAFPIEGTYELSLRLRLRGGAKDRVMARLPHCLGVEREHGWLAVEVPGKMRIGETSREGLVAVAVPELPTEARASAVSPILDAYRYHAASPALGLSVERLPEQELEEGAIDVVEATSVLAAEGKLVTDLRVVLRNASRPSLALGLPPNTEVRAVRLDGEPARPSRGEDGKLLLPLQRSRGADHEEPITLDIVLESSLPALGLFGAPELALPALDLGAAAWRWRLYLPAHNEYLDLRTDVPAEVYAGAASWHKPPHLKRAVRWNESEEGEERAAPAVAPTWTELIATNTEKSHVRYWVGPGTVVRARVPFVRAYLLLPLKFAFVLGLFAGLGSFLYRRAGRNRATSGKPRTSLVELAVRLPGRIKAFFRRQTFSRPLAARVALLSIGFLAVAGFFVNRFGKLVQALFSG